jgi:hypothetical protein
MKKSAISAILLCAMSFGCGAQRSTVGSSSNSNSNKISFGLYDISSSSPYSVVTSAFESTAPARATVANTSANASARPASVNDHNSSDKQTIAIQQNPGIGRRIVRNAELQLETSKPEDSQQKIAAIAENSGGFVVESQQSMSDIHSPNRDMVAMTVRVPGDRFASSVDDIRRTGERVISENIKGEDVTEEFIDIEARLKAKKALEEQFMTIMKRADTVEDALSVQSQLADVRGEIEKIEGRKRFLENQASLSTIKVRLQTPAALAASGEGFGYRLTDSLSRGSDSALNFILGLITFLIAVLPFTLFVGLPLGLLFRYFWRRQSRPKSVSEIAEEEISIT